MKKLLTCFLVLVMFAGVAGAADAKTKSDAERRRERERRELRAENRNREAVMGIIEESVGKEESLSSGKKDEIYSILCKYAEQMEDAGSEAIECMAAGLDMTEASLSKIMPKAGIFGTNMDSVAVIDVIALRGRNLMNSEQSAFENCERKRLSKVATVRNICASYFVSFYKMTLEDAVAMLKQVGL